MFGVVQKDSYAFGSRSRRGSYQPFLLFGKRSQPGDLLVIGKGQPFKDIADFGIYAAQFAGQFLNVAMAGLFVRLTQYRPCSLFCQSDPDFQNLTIYSKTVWMIEKILSIDGLHLFTKKPPELIRFPATLGFTCLKRYLLKISLGGAASCRGSLDGARIY